MKMAKKEAQALIDTYRREKEAAYQASMQKTLGSSDSDAENLRKQTDAEIAKLQAEYDQNKKNVVNMLVHGVCTVKCIVPEGRKRNMPQAL
jgi:ATP synthase subunit G